MATYGYGEAEPLDESCNPLVLVLGGQPDRGPAAARWHRLQLHLRGAERARAGVRDLRERAGARRRRHRSQCEACGAACRAVHPQLLRAWVPGRAAVRELGSRTALI